MNKRGFVLIYALLLLTIISVSALFILKTSTESGILTSYYRDKIKARYIVESDAYQAVDRLRTADYFYTGLQRDARRSSGHSKSFQHEISSLDGGAKRRVEYTKDTGGYLHATFVSGYKGINSRVNLSLRLYNELFYMEGSKYKLEHDMDSRLQDFIESEYIPEAVSDIFIAPVDKRYVLKSKLNTLYLSTAEEPTVGEETESPEEEDPPTPESMEVSVLNDAVLGTNIDFLGSEKIRLSGIMIIDVNTKIETDIELSGILIINSVPSGIVKKVRVVGGVIFSDSIPGFVEHVSNFSRVEKWGSVKKGFFNPKLTRLTFSRE